MSSMFELLVLIIKVIAFIMFIVATYKSAQYYKNRSNDYESELEKEISRRERRKTAVEHFVCLIPLLL